MRPLLALLLLLICSSIIAQREKLIVPTGVEMTLGTITPKQGDYVYTLSSKKAVMWSVKDQRQMYSFDVDGAIVVSHDDTKLITGQKVYSTQTGRLLYEISAIKGTKAFSDNDEFIYCFSDFTATRIKTSDGTVAESAEMSCYHKDAAENIGNNKIITLSSQGWHVWSTQPFAKLNSYTFKDEFTEHSVVYNRAANTISALHLEYGKRSLDIYNPETGALIKRIPDLPLAEASILVSSYDSPELLLQTRTNLVPTKNNYAIINAATGTITKRGNIDYDILNTFSGIKKMTLIDAGYAEKEHGISMYKYDMATDKAIDPFARKLMYTYNLNMLNDSDALNIEGRFVIDLTNLKKHDQRLLQYYSPLHASADGSYVLRTNRSPSELYYTLVTDTSKKNINIVPATLNYDGDFLSVSADGSKIYYVATRKSDQAFGIFEHDVLTKKAELLQPVKKLEDVWMNVNRQYVRYIEHDAKLAKSFLKIYDVTSRKIISSEEVKELNDEELDAQMGEKSKYGIMSDSIYIKNPEWIFHENHQLGKKLPVITHSQVRNYFFSKNEKYVFTVETDQSIDVWQVAGNKKLGTLYIFDDNNYVFVDESGRFDGTEGGIKQLYYLKNRNVITLDLVYEKYYTPNLYQRLINGEVFPPMPTDDLKLAPKVKMAYVEKQRNLEVSDDVPSYTNTTGVAEITVMASSDEDAIDEIRLFQNGKVLNLVTRNLIVSDDQAKTSTKKYTVSLLPGNNEIRAIALNTQRTESQPDIINVVYNDGASANTNVPPVVNNKANVILDKIDKNATLHLLVVGINAYQNPKMSLNYALADATAFKDEVEKDAKTVITNVQTYFVTDEAANKTGIVKTLQQVQQTAKPQDVFIFYYAGHGVIADGNKEFYLVPNNVTDLHNVDEALKQNGIAAKDLQQYAINIQAQKQLFILDACQSAGAFADMLSSDGNQQKNIALVARSTGTHWMAASGAQQYANEFSTLGHGAFTYVLLQALKGEAASNKMITVDGLKTYMQNGVPALMKKYNGSQQTPASYGFGNDFPVEILKQ